MSEIGLHTGWIPGGPDVPAECSLDEHADLIEQYRVAQSMRDRADAEMTHLRSLIEKVLPEDPGGGVRGTIHGQVVLSYVPHGQRQVNLKVLRERYPEIAQACESWAIRRPFKVIRDGAL